MTSKLLALLTVLLTHLEVQSGATLTELGDRVASHEHARADGFEQGVAVVQVELLPDPDAAAALAAKLDARLDAAGLGLEARVEAVPAEPELPVSYRVVVGPFAEFEDAERARTELDALGVRGFVRELELQVGC